METPTPPPSSSPLQLHESLSTNDHEELLADHAAAERQNMSPSPTVTPNNGLHVPPDHQELSTSSSMSRSAPVTRTVAIIKNHALQHRFDIEPRIQEASFEIVKERQMEFDVETDPDTLYDLFGDDADSLAEGPVWVYVLERKRAVEVWNTLMGDRDPELARVEAPNSLRALYGISLQQNALMGSPDTQTAEIQISALFASSPPFRSTELPSEGDTDRFNSVRSISSSILESLRTEKSEGGYAASSVTGASTLNGSNGRSPFRARPIPATNVEPDIVPRMTRAAALRITGIVADGSPNKPRTPISKERHAQTFANVPGHRRAESIAVASTAPPTIAPRMTKAASLRIAKDAAAANGKGPSTPPVKKRSTMDGAAKSAEKPKATFEGVPGHKRRETISVASVRAPTVAPRLNKSAALRQMQKEGGATPPTSFRGSSATLSRATSTDSVNSRRQSAVPATPSSRTSSRPPPSRRASSALDMRVPTSTTATTSTTSASASTSAGVNEPVSGGTSRPPSAAGRLRPRPSSVAGPPTIAPRTNKSAALRAAKMEAEAKAQAAVNAKKTRTSRPPPSSFKATVAT
ncbi:hypothetical protein NP233_g3259 [Leucocoprinus birnbaumii]|uniref:Nucleoside diphosphate kinase n=1 Tax=Leucocoprinus birnbaumii TaxID=56174 RepID=A0AAD5VY85_9AGAR|nr:hypothetical protein NP233_g3259 [Leucocoprinus birnbaumii]